MCNASHERAELEDGDHVTDGLHHALEQRDDRFLLFSSACTK